MELIIHQILSMLPLFIFILLGYIAGKTLKIESYDLLSKIILLIFTPIIAFNALSTAKFDIGLLTLPVLFFFTTSFLAISTRILLKKLSNWDTNLINTFSYSAGSGNVSFYGVPAVLILFGDKYLPIILIGMIGYIIYDSSIGYLIVTNQKFKFKEIALKLIKFPPFIGVLIGSVAAILGLNFSNNDAYKFIVSNSQSTIATLGIFLIGLAVSKLKIGMNFSYLLAIAIVKGIITPLLMILIIILDKYTLFIISGYSEILILIASVPVATNSVILATNYTKKAETAALGVLITALLSLITIPIWQVILNYII